MRMVAPSPPAPPEPPRLLDPRTYAQPAIVLGALLVASALTEGFGLLLLVPMLSAVGAKGGANGAIDRAMAMLGVPTALEPLLALFVALILARAIIGHLAGLARQTFEVRLIDGLRRRAWSALLHCDWRVLVTMRQSDNASLLITNIDRIGLGVDQAIGAVASAVTLAGIGLAAFALSPLVSGAALAGGALVLLAYRTMRRRAGRLGEQLDAAYGTVHAAFYEGLGALRIIKSFGREDRAERDYAAGFAALRTAERAYLRDLGLSQIALQGGGALVLALLVWLGLTRWHAGVGTILPLVALFGRALPLLGALQIAWQHWEHARPAIGAAMGLIARAEAAREPDGDGELPPPLDRTMALDRVTVRFPGRPRLALDDVSFTIAARRITALVGASGAGKSTVADLAGALIAPDSGAITVDGIALEGGKRRAWRSRVAYVQQEAVLFSGSVRDNLLWAQPRAGEPELLKALRDASAQFVEALPKGLDTRVGEGGRQLSGGERQRIVLARALLRDPALLILDEATSALDPENEQAIAAAVSGLRTRLTILIVCHRGALSDLADHVVRLDRGKVVPDGAPARD